MDGKGIVKALVEGFVSYGFYYLMTAPDNELVLAKANLERKVAIYSGYAAAFFGHVSLRAELASINTIQKGATL